MVPLLLLLFLPKPLAGQGDNTVLFQVSDSEIKVNASLAVILDRWSHVQCQLHGFQCIFECTPWMSPGVSRSSDCLEAATTTLGSTTIYHLKNLDVNCTMTLCNVTTILPMIKDLRSDSSDQTEMMQLFYVRESCLDLFTGNREVMAAFINVERSMIHDIMATQRLEPGGSVNYKWNFLSLNVFNISSAELSSAGAGARIQKEAPQLLPQNASFIPEIWLPAHALRSIPKEERVFGLVSYLQQSHFQFNQEEFASVIIRIEPLGGRLQNLNVSVKMTFGVDVHTDMDNDTRLQCHYFHEEDLLWRTDGCETDHSNFDSHSEITCHCDHTTPFAVLMVREPIAQVHWTVLSYISYIGCGLSAFFSALSLVMYVFSRRHQHDYSISIHVSLSGALFLLNGTFLLAEWGATAGPAWVCVLVAALMHYSLLCCFTWMAMEALHLYLLLIKVFNTYYKHYLLKLSLAGWGIPGVIVAVSLGLKDVKHFYGVTTILLADTNQTNAICWITDDTFFYSLNLAYFTLTFMFNSGILLSVACSICKMKQAYSDLKLGAKSEGKARRYPEMFRVSCRSGITVLGLTCLMGTTWGLAFLSSGYVNYPVLYLFCIFNSTQGFFIFLWICLSAQKQRKKDLEDRMTSSPAKTSEIKTD